MWRTYPRTQKEASEQDTDCESTMCSGWGKYLSNHPCKPRHNLSHTTLPSSTAHTPGQAHIGTCEGRVTAACLFQTTREPPGKGASHLDPARPTGRCTRTCLDSATHRPVPPRPRAPASPAPRAQSKGPPPRFVHSRLLACSCSLTARESCASHDRGLVDLLSPSSQPVLASGYCRGNYPLQRILVVLGNERLEVLHHPLCHTHRFEILVGV